MRIVVCCTCGTESTVEKWFKAGWIKAELVFKNGTKATHRQCAECRKDGGPSLLEHAEKVFKGEAICGQKALKEAV